MIDATYIVTSLVSLAITIVLVKYLPKFLAFARLDKQVDKNALAIINGLVIAFVLVESVIKPISTFFGAYGGKMPF